MIRDNIVYGPELIVPLNDESTGWILYKQLLKYVSNNKIFVDVATEKFLTYKQFLQLSCSLAEALRKDGIYPEENAAICSQNNIYYFVILAAGLFVGLPIAFMCPFYTESELNHAFHLTKPRKIFCSKDQYEKFLKLKSKNECVDRIIIFDANESLPESISLMDYLIKNGAVNTDIYKFSPSRLDSRSHVAFIMFSSGTTGLPKGVLTTHLNVNFTLNSEYYSKIWPHSSNNNEIATLPFFHAFGLQTTLGNIFCGKTVHVLKRFDLAAYLARIQKFQMEILTVVPRLLVLFGKEPIVSQFDFTFVKDIFYASAPAGLTTLKTVQERLGVQPRQGYGLTETTFTITAVPPNISKPKSIGVVLPGLSVCVRDVDSGEKLPTWDHGEICVKGDIVMMGYYNNEEANREIFTEDGFLRTGDIGYYDDEGYLYVVDRIKELIKYKSFQVPPAELEAILISHPKIAQAAVVGLPEEDVGELPLAFVVKAANSDLTEDEVKSYVAGLLPKNKQLHGGVKFIDQMPLNSVGKIRRKDLRKMLLEAPSKL